MFSSAVFSGRVILQQLENKKGSKGVGGHALSEKFFSKYLTHDIGNLYFEGLQSNTLTSFLIKLL